MGLFSWGLSLSSPLVKEPEPLKSSTCLLPAPVEEQCRKDSCSYPSVGVWGSLVHPSCCCPSLMSHPSLTGCCYDGSCPAPLQTECQVRHAGCEQPLEPITPQIQDHALGFRAANARVPEPVSAIMKVSRTVTSVPFAVVVPLSIAPPLVLLLLLGGGIDAMLSPFTLPLPAALPELLADPPSVGRRLHVGRAVMPEGQRAVQQGQARTVTLPAAPTAP